jgi:hypothetical protein
MANMQDLRKERNSTDPKLEQDETGQSLTKSDQVRAKWKAKLKAWPIAESEIASPNASQPPLKCN